MKRVLAGSFGISGWMLLRLYHTVDVVMKRHFEQFAMSHETFTSFENWSVMRQLKEQIH